MPTTIDGSREAKSIHEISTHVVDAHNVAIRLAADDTRPGKYEWNVPCRTLTGLAQSIEVVIAGVIVLCFISNELQISLVCLGVADAREAIGGDVQLMRRFEELTLPRWQGDEEFEQLVVTILRHLPLKRASQNPCLRRQGA